MIRKKCSHCGKIFIRTNPKIRNVKFCSKQCKNKEHYKKYGAKYQRDMREKKLLEKYSKDELIQCKICGKWFRQVGSHIWGEHRITAREYREEYGFDVKRGQLPDDLKNLYAEQAIKCGGVKNLEIGAKFRFKKNQKGVGIYKRSEQTLKRLEKNRFNIKKKGIYKKCLVCGKEIYVMPSKINKTKYCSISCSNKDR